jgi:hypothetical protein
LLIKGCNQRIRRFEPVNERNRDAKWIFGSLAQGLRALALFSLVYVFIYLLLRLEDNALLVGAVARVLAVAAVMYFYPQDRLV